MNFNKKIFIILLFAICIVSLLFGSVAYYRFLVSGNINGSTGNAVFNVTGFKDDSSSIKTIELGKVSPGDSGEFTITLDASGSTVDMYATLSIDRGDSSNNTELPTNLKFYTTPDHKSELHKYYSFLETTGTQKEELTIYWYWNPFISDEDDNKYINREFSANIKVSAVQISEYAMMKSYIRSTEFWNNTYKPYIRTITFGNDLSNKPESCTGDSDLCWDVSYDASQKKKVYAYLVDSGLKDSTDSTKVLYNLYIVSEAPIFAPINCGAIFCDFKNLISIKFNDNFNTSKVTNMGSMFKGCSSLTSLDLSSFNTSKVISMQYMFGPCYNQDGNCPLLLYIDLSNFNTLNVTNMESMFGRCTALKELDLSSFNTSKVTNMLGMFSGCSSLITLDLSSFNTSNVEIIYRNTTGNSGMFMNCSSLKELDLSSFNTSKITSMAAMFYNCISLTSLDLSNFNTSNVTGMYQMFSYCSSLTSLDLSNFNTSNITSMYQMFYSCSSLTSLDLSSFNTSNVTSMSGMFQSCSSLTNLNLSSFDTSNVITYGQGFSGMFKSCPKLTTTINIMNENITSYEYMFSGAATANGAKITVNYIAALDTIAEGETQSLIDKLIATKSPNSNIVKGSQI